MLLPALLLTLSLSQTPAAESKPPAKAPSPKLSVDGNGVQTTFEGRGCVTRPTKELWFKIPEAAKPLMVCRLAAMNQFTDHTASFLMKDPGDFPKPGKSYPVALDEFNGVPFVGDAQLFVVGINGIFVTAELRFKPEDGSDIKQLGGQFKFLVDVEKAKEVAARVAAAAQ
jgi:hypothetical protein